MDDTTEEITTSVELTDETTTEEAVFLIEDETLLQHEYITETRTVVTNTDIYEMQLKQYNLMLLLFWTLVAMFVIRTISGCFKFFYRG